MTSRLEVRWKQALIGVLDETSFTYATSWVDSPGRFALSARLPMRSEPFTDEAGIFFGNLLPEADVRRSLCARLGLSPDNDFALLAAIGGDCAGAISLVDADAKVVERRSDYRRITTDELKAIATNQVFSSIDGRRGVRLSLAGAQDKLPVRIEGAQLWLPLGEAPSTHLLKFPSPRFKHLPANEVFMSMVARALELPVPETEWRPLGREGMCVVTRYDRARVGESWERIHQEDLCQALGTSAHRKYEREGGPSFATCFELIRSASAAPVIDAQTTLRWLVFNVAAFNANGHAKNLSLLHGAEGTRLAPLYDLVCTRAYPTLSRELAMSVNGENDPTKIRRMHWEALARSIGVSARFVVELVRDVTERLPAAFNDAAREFRSRYGEKPALQLILPRVRKQARRIADQLD